MLPSLLTAWTSAFGLGLYNQDLSWKFLSILANTTKLIAKGKLAWQEWVKYNY